MKHVDQRPLSRSWYRSTARKGPSKNSIVALVAVLDQLAAAFEIIFVEDCGGDCSWRSSNT